MPFKDREVKHIYHTTMKQGCIVIDFTIKYESIIFPNAPAKISATFKINPGGIYV